MCSKLKEIVLKGVASGIRFFRIIYPKGVETEYLSEHIRCVNEVNLVATVYVEEVEDLEKEVSELRGREDVRLFVLE